MNGKNPLLKKEIGLGGAVMMGLGSILGTGVFVSVGIAAGISGPSVILAVLLAAVVAMCNAFSSAQLAANHPVSGGTYEYGYHYLHPLFGFTAGWMFLCAKSASAATASLGFSGYLVNSLGLPSGYFVPVALLVCVLFTGLVLSGVRRASVVNSVIVGMTLLSLGAFVVCGLPSVFSTDHSRFIPFFAPGPEHGKGAMAALLHATALMFVAYTGYGRIATLGEEVHDPRRIIPRAIVLTLIVSAVVYTAVSAVAVGAVGSEALSQAAHTGAAPLEVVARGFSPAGVHLVVALGAMTAMLGVLLNLILGLSRVLLAMGRRGDMPGAVARLNATQTTPYVAVIVVGMIIIGLASLGSVKTAWTFSAFTVLIYYAITNFAALRLTKEQRLYPRIFAWGGLGACLFLAFWVEVQVWVAGFILIMLGMLWWVVAQQIALRKSA
ncbi:MAG: amino acid permease [Candidatus Omnitrophica bacterium]|nr:amino acid permease [Candidatus Omnitrophota bacterium]